MKGIAAGVAAVAVWVVVTSLAIAVIVVRRRWQQATPSDGEDVRGVSDGTRVHVVVSLSSARWTWEHFARMESNYGDYVPEDLMLALRQGIRSAENHAFKEHAARILAASGVKLRDAAARGDVDGAREVWEALDAMFRG